MAAIIDGATVSDLRVTGAWLGELARPFGVRNVVQAGRSYSFSVAIDQVPAGPLYFPAQRIACTPIGDRLRVAGMMEFRKPESPHDHRRVQAIADAARPLLHRIDFDNRQDEGVGSRPCTIDGLPLIGATKSDRVYVARVVTACGASLTARSPAASSHRRW